MKKSFYRGGSLVAGALLAMGLVGATQAATELTVYTAVEAEDLKKYAARFNEDHPDIKINWVRDSTGIVTAKLLAEKENPRADVIWGLAATSLLLMKGEGMLEAYAPKGLNALDSKFRDKSNPPTWTGMDAWVAAICVNTKATLRCRTPTHQGRDSLTSPAGYSFLEKRVAGRTWTHCIKILAITHIQDPSRANRRQVAR
jgi:iron(III) transport system substrate-binding protein